MKDALEELDERMKREDGGLWADNSMLISFVSKFANKYPWVPRVGADLEVKTQPVTVASLKEEFFGDTSSGADLPIEDDSEPRPREELVDHSDEVIILGKEDRTENPNLQAVASMTADRPP
jgi:hypothetical protein